MKKSISAFILVFCLFNMPVLASNKIDSVDVTVNLYKDGSARVEQTWETISDENTEFYIVQSNMGNMEIKDFSVSDENGRFSDIGSWNINASRTEKAQKCGIVKKSSGYELCWGIGEYGAHTYKISYIMTNAVKSYTDYDGFNIRFINDKMSPAPRKGSVKIIAENTPLTGENAGIWGFGYKGEIVFQNGIVSANTEEPMGSDSHMTVMLRLNKGILEPVSRVDDSFEKVMNNAFKGSDYRQMTVEDIIVLVVIIAVVIAILIITAIIIIAIIKNSIKLRKIINSADYYRDIPQNGNLDVAAWMGADYKLCENKEGTLMGAHILRFMQNGCVELVTKQEDRKLGLGSKASTSIRLIKSPDKGDETAKKLYDLMKAAAGEDGILQQKEFERYCAEEYSDFNSIEEDARANGDRILANQECFTSSKLGYKYYRATRALNEKGIEELQKFAGLKKYLLDFSLISEREAPEVHIWNDYMVYACFLGIADKVEEKLKKYFPKYVEENTTQFTAMHMAMSYNRVGYIARNKAYNANRIRTSGGGGSSSFGGGGGFSGGGSGGGSR